MPIALTLALLLAASPNTEAPVTANTPVLCDDERASCRDGCSFDYGSSVGTRDKLVTCLNRCDERRDVCLLRIVAKQREQAPSTLENRPAPKAAGGEARTSIPAAPYTLPPTRFSGPAESAAPAEELPPASRSATKAKELPDAPAPEPLTAPEVKKDEPAAGSQTPAKTGAKKKGKKKKGSR
jgi:hypothetical protein